MRTRVITGLVALCVLIPILIFSDTVLLDIGLAACCALAVFEMLRCVGTVKKLWISVPMLVVSPLLIMSVRPLKSAVENFSFTQVTLPVLLSAMLYLLAVMVFSKNKITVEDIAVSGFMAAYITAAFASVLFLRDSTGGAYTYLLVFIGAWVTDTFAYFCGMLFGRGGKHKLIPDVSPKKTVEGSIGGTAFCMVAMVVFGLIVNGISEHLHANFVTLIIGGLLAAIVAQIGDLCMSVIKRTYGIKDYGKLFPGHGGMLDRFDSVIAVSIVLACFCSFFNFFEVM